MSSHLARPHHSASIILPFLLSAVLLASCVTPGPAVRTGSRHPLRDARQLLVVTTAAWDSCLGFLQAFERTSVAETWTAVGTPRPITIGSGGLAWGTGLHGRAAGPGPVKREGDLRSPAGAFLLGAVYGYAPASEADRFMMPYIPIDSTTVCVDDPRSLYYNRIVRKNDVTSTDWNSAERMWAGSSYYRWGIVIDHNRDPRVAGDGSCIFIHVWGSPTEPTTGCTSLDEAKLLEIMKWLQPNKRPVLVQLPQEVYARLRLEWDLP